MKLRRVFFGGPSVASWRLCFDRLTADHNPAEDVDTARTFAVLVVLSLCMQAAVSGVEVGRNRIARCGMPQRVWADGVDDLDLSAKHGPQVGSDAHQHLTITPELAEPFKTLLNPGLQAACEPESPAQAPDAKKPTLPSGLLPQTNNSNRSAWCHMASSLAQGLSKTSLVELPAANSGKWPSLLKHTTAAREDQVTSIAADQHYKCTGTRGQKQKWLQPEEVDELVCAYESGLTVYELAKRFECHRTTVSEHLKSRGVVMRLKPMTDEEINRAIELYGSGLSFAKVGKTLGRDGETIRQRLIERGATMRDSHGRMRNVDAEPSDVH